MEVFDVREDEHAVVLACDWMHDICFSLVRPLRAHSSNSGGASTAVAVYLVRRMRWCGAVVHSHKILELPHPAAPYRVTTAPMKYYIHYDTTIILT